MVRKKNKSRYFLVIGIIIILIVVGWYTFFRGPSDNSIIVSKYNISCLSENANLVCYRAFDSVGAYQDGKIASVDLFKYSYIYNGEVILRFYCESKDPPFSNNQKYYYAQPSPQILQECAK